MPPVNRKPPDLQGRPVLPAEIAVLPGFHPATAAPPGCHVPKEKQQGAVMNKRGRKSWSRTIVEGIVMIAAVLLIGLVAHAAHLLR